MAVKLVRNGHLVDPSQNIDKICDIMIEDGNVVKVEENINDPCDMVIEAHGKYVFPGLVDMHVHLRDPGFTVKEDVYTGCNAAVSGGVTSLLCMPNTDPVIDNEETINYLKNAAKTAKANIYVCGTISKGLKGDMLSDFEMYKKLGVIAVSDDGRPVESEELMAQAVKKADEIGLTVTSHCEDLTQVKGGIMNKGEVSDSLGVKGIDRSAENNATQREIDIAKATNGRVHIAHVSTKEAVEMIRKAKKEGVRVTAETCPHYFAYTDEKLRSRDADYRMNPPLRTADDVRAIIDGIKDGTLDCITTDHAPHEKAKKSDFVTAMNGVVGLETSLAAGLKFLVEKENLPLSRLIELMSYNPAKILNIKAGSLKPGMPADLIVVDIDRYWTVLPERLNSKSKNSAFKFEELKGKVKYTFKDGELVYVMRN